MMFIYIAGFLFTTLLRGKSCSLYKHYIIEV